MPLNEIAELEMFSFFELIPDLVCIANREGYFKKVNQAVIDTLGYTREELMAQPISHFIYPADREITSSRRKELLQGKTLINFDNRYVSKSGDIIWLHWTSIYIPEKQIVLAIAKNITGRKQKEIEIEEKSLRFENLASHFKGKLENDKRSLATELHEELAQLATVAKMNLTWLKENCQLETAEHNSKVEDTLTILDKLIESIRRLSFAISPDMLHNLGLNETLNWLCEEFSQLNNIPCIFESTCPDEELSREIQLDFFRICQESLSNVMYHAKAEAVWVNLESTEDRINLHITDNGKGFLVDQLDGASGINNMRKRADSVNGQLVIHSELGKGTRVALEIFK